MYKNTPYTPEVVRIFPLLMYGLYALRFFFALVLMHSYESVTASTNGVGSSSLSTPAFLTSVGLHKLSSVVKHRNRIGNGSSRGGMSSLSNPVNKSDPLIAYYLRPDFVDVGSGYDRTSMRIPSWLKSGSSESLSESKESFSESPSSSSSSPLTDCTVTYTPRSLRSIPYSTPTPPPLVTLPPRKVCLMVEPTPFTHVSGYSNRYNEMLGFFAKAGDNVEIVTTDDAKEVSFVQVYDLI